MSRVPHHPSTTKKMQYACPRTNDQTGKIRLYAESGLTWNQTSSSLGLCSHRSTLCLKGIREEDQ
eukprot:5510063-Pleurochrysis_carterae.AAC.1